MMTVMMTVMMMVMMMVMVMMMMMMTETTMIIRVQISLLLRGS
jgi:hypothetical protein